MNLLKATVNWNNTFSLAECQSANFDCDEGLYAFVFPTEKGPQVFYIGKSTSLKSRMAAHLDYYRKGAYWLPASIDLFEKDIYEINRYRASEGYYQKPEQTPAQQKIGTEIAQKTQVVISQVDCPAELRLEHIETLLILAVQRKFSLPTLGWMGDSRLAVQPSDIEVANKFRTQRELALLAPNLPEKVSYRINIFAENSTSAT